ncbi:MAG: carbamate kinase [Candidatus Xenobia bacterium]
MRLVGLAIIAVGGNALIRDPQHQSVPDQAQAASETMDHVATLVAAGWSIVVTHGNGPQVGFIMLRSEMARTVLHPVPLESIVADTQGALGYNFQQGLENSLRRRGLSKPVATVVTQTVVDRADPAFARPTKPVGPFYSEAQAKERQEHDGWDVVEDAGRGWRRVVPSPQPHEIVELDVVRMLVDNGVVVIAVGGGGIPVVRDEQGQLSGIAAVIDKDLASSLLAVKLDADVFLIATGVEKVCLNFGKPEQQVLDRVSVSELRRYTVEGHFKPGSMLPKIQAVLHFVERSGRKAIITTAERMEDALAGETGTHVLPDA